MIVIIVGKECSGKTTTAKKLIKKGYKPILQYTTRPKRDGEKDGIDYHFVTMEEFDKLNEEGFFAETASYNAKFGFCKYGSAKKDYETTENSVIILNPIGLKNIKVTENILPIYLEISESTIIKRGEQRKDDKEELYRRLKRDREDFKDIKEYIKYSITCDYVDEDRLVDIIDQLAQSTKTTDVEADDAPLAYYKVLDISMKHITLHTAKILGLIKFQGMYTDEDPLETNEEQTYTLEDQNTGKIIHTTEEELIPDIYERDDGSYYIEIPKYIVYNKEYPDLSKCFEYAKRHNCKALSLRANGAIVNELPIYNNYLD